VFSAVDTGIAALQRGKIVESVGAVGAIGSGISLGALLAVFTAEVYNAMAAVLSFPAGIADT